MKILITGSEGMLGQALMKSLTAIGLRPDGVDILSKSYPADITDKKSIEGVIRQTCPEVVIHTAAYTDVDDCETASDKACLINGQGTKNVAEACKTAKAFLIYMSTDYIFDGNKTTAYNEEDIPNPISVYGKSKLMGEDSIKTILNSYLIIRTSWLFGKGGKNFVDTIISKAEAEKRLEVVDDQYGSPTYSTDLAEAIVRLLIKSRVKSLGVNLLHITNSGSCTWYEYAKEILKTKGIEEVRVEPATSEEINRPAKRPKMSILDNTKFAEINGYYLPNWKDALRRYIKKEAI